jgi:hypothetical protein
MMPAERKEKKWMNWNSWKNRAPEGYAPGDPRKWEQTKLWHCRINPLGEKLWLKKW